MPLWLFNTSQSIDAKAAAANPVQITLATEDGFVGNYIANLSPVVTADSITLKTIMGCTYTPPANNNSNNAVPAALAFSPSYTQNYIVTFSGTTAGSTVSFTPIVLPSFPIVIIN